MSIASGLALWQEILLICLALISLVYVFYFRIWVTIATGSDLVFVAALCVAVASVAAPILFAHGARALVDRSSLPEALVSLDEKVAAIESLPGELVDRALTKLGYEPEAAIEPEPGAAAQPGPFEARIRPSVEALVAAVLRAASFFTATVLLLMALALRSSTSTARALQALSARTEALETRLAELNRAESIAADRGTVG